MVKVLLINDRLAKGGKERRIIELLKYFSKTKEVYFEIILMDERVDYPIIRELGFPVHILKRKTKKDITCFKKIYTIVKQFKPQIIHSWSSMTDIYSLPIAKLTATPFITSMIAQAPDNLSSKDEDYFRSRFVFPFATVITSNSLAGIHAYKAPVKKTVCIYNGFDFKRIQVLTEPRVLKQDIGIKDEFVIGMVAAFEPRKDYNTFIRASLEVIKENKNNVRFIIIGDGALKEELVNKIDKRYKSYFHFLGKIHNVESYINLFDIGVLCTNTAIHKEGISNAIMEYMALGKPVIATEGGGTDEIVVDGKTGFLIPPYDYNLLKEKINFLMKNPQTCLEMGIKGFERINTDFTIKEMCSKFFGIYNNFS